MHVSAILGYQQNFTICDTFYNHLTRYINSGVAIEEAAVPASIPTKVALSHVGELVSFALLANNPFMVEAAMKLQTLVHDHSIRLAAVAKQKSIRDFFSAK